MSPRFGLVIPTLARPSLSTLLDSLAQTLAGRGVDVVVVDDRRQPDPPLDLAGFPATVVTTGGRGPAAARNRGWQELGTEWVVFLDDDVVVTRGWHESLVADLAAAGQTGAVGSQAQLRVPRPAGRRPNDAERGTAGLETAQWITADLALRRNILSAIGGFDERFPRAFREDADLGLRLTAAGGHIVRGRREVLHPVRPSRWNASIAAQRGNRDDALMRKLHGRTWHLAAGAEVGRRPRHLAVAACAASALLLAAAGRRRDGSLAALGWLAGTAELACARIAPGPRDPAEVARMVVTSVVIPVAAARHWLAGLLAHRHARAWDAVRPLDALLVDRDGTLVHDVPYNKDAGAVRPVDGARAALDRVRAAGLPVGLVTNQSGLGRGLITEAQLAGVHRRLEQLLGPFDDWQICPHTENDGCDCRKPQPGMILAAAAKLGIPPHRMLMVGDIEADLLAARAAGALGVLIPNPATRQDEIGRAEHTVPTLAAAVDFLLDRGRS